MIENGESEIRKKCPGLARKADSGKGRAAAIKLNCYACMGGSKQLVKDCESYSCFFWPYRPGGSGERPEGSVPSEAWYEKQSAKKRKKAEGLAKYRAENAT